MMALFKNHLFFQSNANALQLLMYFDEIEVCDPLASHKGQHKLGNVKCKVYKHEFLQFTGVFYYSIANLLPTLRSTHRSIQLIAVVTCPLLEKYGFKEVLKPFIDDVSNLYNVSCSIVKKQLVYNVYIH